MVTYVPRVPLPPISLTWACLPTGRYASLERVILDNVDVSGVYVIWNQSWTIRLGQGDVASRLLEHRENHLITRHAAQGELWVTWAPVSALLQDGVERYLAERLQPKEGERFPAAAAIPVNLPWAA